MKRTRFVVLLMALMAVFLLVGCDAEAYQAYEQETAAMEAWKGSDFEGSYDYTLVFGDEEVPLSARIEGRVSQTSPEEGQVYLKMAFDPATIDGQTIALPPMEYYIDTTDRAFYMNKDFFLAIQEMMKAAGETPSFDLATVEEEYIRIDLSAEGMEPNVMDELLPEGMMDQGDVEAFIALAEVLFDGVDSNLTFTQDGRTFTFEATAEDLIDAGLLTVANIEENWDLVSQMMIDLSPETGYALTEADMDDLRDALQSGDLEGLAADGKALFEGTRVTTTETFNDDAHDLTMAMTLNMQGGYAMEMHMAMTTVRNDDVQVVMPTSFVTLPLADLLTTEMDGIPVFYEGDNIAFPDQQPVIVNDRVLVPYRAVAEAMDFEVVWDEEARAVTASRGDRTVVLTIDELTAKVNEQELTSDVAPQIINDRTMVPIRLLSESLGYDVEWVDDVVPFVVISDRDEAA